MVEIEYCELRNTYKILWLRYVYGVDLNTHCMKSLLGHNDKRVRGFMRSLPPNLELEESRFYYLCGVDVNFDWNKNLHVAFVRSVGRQIIIDNEFVKLKINNARQIFIDTKYINWRLPQSRNKLFSTCRNWQFANMLASLPDVPQTPTQQQFGLFDEPNK